MVKHVVKHIAKHTGAMTFVERHSCLNLGLYADRGLTKELLRNEALNKTNVIVQNGAIASVDLHITATSWYQVFTSHACCEITDDIQGGDYPILANLGDSC